MLQEVMYAGFGGQGVVLGATVLAHMAARAGMNATTIPNYGNEQRGGGAFCDCKFVAPPEEIYDPRYDHPTMLIAMNEYAYDKYGPSVIDGGVILFNSDVSDPDFSGISRVTIIKIPCTTIADSIGSALSANFVMTGAAVKLGAFFTVEHCIESIADYFEQENRSHFIERNVEAFKAGYAYV